MSLGELIGAQDLASPMEGLSGAWVSCRDATHRLVFATLPREALGDVDRGRGRKALISAHGATATTGSLR